MTANTSSAADASAMVDEFQPPPEDPAFTVDRVVAGADRSRGRRARAPRQSDAHKVGRNSGIGRAIVEPAQERHEVGGVGRCRSGSEASSGQAAWPAESKPEGDGPGEECRGIGRAILPIRSGQSVRTRERRPSNVRRRDVALRAAAAVLAVTLDARERRGRHGRAVTDPGRDRPARRAQTGRIDLTSAIDRSRGGAGLLGRARDAGVVGRRPPPGHSRSATQRRARPPATRSPAVD